MTSRIFHTEPLHFYYFARVSSRSRTPMNLGARVLMVSLTAQLSTTSKGLVFANGALWSPSQMDHHASR